MNSAYNDNYLTTNFNNSHPNTYSTYTPPIPNVDLPKINFNKPIINKTLQLPQYTRQNVNNIPPLPVTTPPFPITLTIPNLSQHPQINTYQPACFTTTSTPPLTYSNQCRTYGNISNNYKSVGNVCIEQQNSNSHSNDVQTKPVLPPPLPIQTHPIFITSTTNNPLSLNTPISSLNNLGSSIPNSTGTSTSSSLNSPSSSSGSQTHNSSKKGQAKVKFSDTVTAFIVPEIKRPTRPALPAHVMDPQKELADSLPLCHPNEDYLKDFAPIRRNESDEATPAPKIKVVHFGVV